MADDTTPEGWGVRHRPAVIAAIVAPLALGLLLLIAGWFYTARLKPQIRQPVHAFPAPGLETYIHEGARDPYIPPKRPRADPAVTAAKRSVAKTGLPGWEAAR